MHNDNEDDDVSSVYELIQDESAANLEVIFADMKCAAELAEIIESLDSNAQAII